MFVLAALPVVRGLRRIEHGETIPNDELGRLRRRTLQLGGYGVAISVGCWIIASVVYPFALRLSVPDLEGPRFRELAIHFVASLVLCGLIAAAYPFLVGTFVGVRALYPAFLRPGSATDRDWRDLARLERRLWPMLALAAAIPLAGVALLVGFGPQNRLALAVLSAAGLLGVGFRGTAGAEYPVGPRRTRQRRSPALGRATGRRGPRHGDDLD